MVKNELMEWAVKNCFNIESQSGENYTVIDFDEFKIKIEGFSQEIYNIVFPDKHKLLCDFFLFLRNNGEKYEGMSIEKFVNEFLKQYENV